MPPKTPPLSKEAEQGLTGPTTPDPSLLHPGHEQSKLEASTLLGAVHFRYEDLAGMGCRFRAHVKCLKQPT